MSFIGETGAVFGGSDYESESPSAVNFSGDLVCALTCGTQQQ